MSRNDDPGRSRRLLVGLRNGVLFVLFGGLLIATGAAVLYGTLSLGGAAGLSRRTAGIAAIVAFALAVAGPTYLLVARERR